jgi:arylsulfatase A-like enzyme
MKRLLTVLAIALALLAHASWAADRPNIIFILADDMGYGDAGCYGQKTLTTPNMDRMAAEGMRFTRHYAGCTVCAPSRCVLMTGLHTGHCRIRGNGPGFIPDTDLTVPKMLKQAGYTTAVIGKYGLGLPLPLDDPQKKGFDHAYGYVATSHAHNCYTDFLVRDGAKVPLRNTIIYGTANKQHEGTGVSEAKGRIDFAPQLMADEVQKYLAERGKDRKPFFLYYALNLPHANNEAKKDSPLGHGLEGPSYGEYANKDWPDVEKGFASAMRFVDNEVGAVLTKLKAAGLDENTIVMFSSDNGPHREGFHDSDFFKSNGGLKGTKRDMTDGGIRVPLIVRWPSKVKAGSVSDHVCGFQDLMATLAELAGTKVDAEHDGVSYAPTLLGKDGQKAHPYLFWNFDEQGGKRAVLKWPWKLIHINTGEGLKPGKAKGQPMQTLLYNLDSDPGEETNVAERNPDITKELEARMKEAFLAP